MTERDFNEDGDREDLESIEDFELSSIHSNGVVEKSAAEPPLVTVDDALQKTVKKDPSLRTIVLYRHHLQELPLILLVIVLTVSAFPLTGAIPSSVQEVSLFSLTFSVPFFALMPAVGFFYVLNRMWNARYEIHEGYVCACEGIVSLTMRDVRIDYENVRGIEIDRNLYQRLAQLGDLKIGSSMHGDVELVMHGIRYPERYREIIEERIKKHFEKLSRNTMVERSRGDTT